MRGRVPLGPRVMLVVVTPDENRDHMWQLLAEGTDDQGAATEGWFYSSFHNLEDGARDMLYGVVSSSVIDENWATVKAALRAFHEEAIRKGVVWQLVCKFESRRAAANALVAFQPIAAANQAHVYSAIRDGVPLVVIQGEGTVSEEVIRQFDDASRK